MSASNLITILSLIVAVYALLPSERLLDLKIKFAWYDRLVVLSGVAVVHYILYLPALQELGWAFPLGPWRWGFTSELATYTIFGAVLAWGLVRLRFGHLDRRRAFAFGHLATKLLHERRYIGLRFTGLLQSQ